MAKQMLLNVIITVAPENVPTFLAALKPCWEQVAAEPGCLFFDVFQDPDKPGRFKFFEMWSESRQWFEEVQLKKPYYVPYAQKSIPLYIEDRVMEYYEREEGWCAFKHGFLAGAVKTG